MRHTLSVPRLEVRGRRLVPGNSECSDKRSGYQTQRQHQGLSGRRSWWARLGLHGAERIETAVAGFWLCDGTARTFVLRALLQRSSWLQGLEGEIDSSHISWLHKDF